MKLAVFFKSNVMIFFNKIRISGHTEHGSQVQNAAPALGVARPDHRPLRLHLGPGTDFTKLHFSLKTFRINLKNNCFDNTTAMYLNT
jgi:hypothetical protein